MIFFLYDAQIMLREKSSFKFSNKVIFYQVLLRLFPVCFPDFIRQIARYPSHKIRKTSSKTIRKINLSKI